MNPIALVSGILPEFGPFDTARAAVGAGFDMAGLDGISAEWTGTILYWLEKNQ